MTFIEELAQQYDVHVRIDKLNGPEAYVIGRAIVLEESLYQPRMNWRFCHELAHILLGHGLQNASFKNEQEAERLAAELMLPAADFRPLVRSWDVSALKERFPHASWEVVARRWAEFRPAVMTVFDDESLTYRWGPDSFAFPIRITQEELAVVQECYSAKSHLRRQTRQLILIAYYIDENRGVLRVILLSEPNEIDYSGGI